MSGFGNFNVSLSTAIQAFIGDSMLMISRDEAVLLLTQFEGETLGHTLTNLLTEVKRLREIEREWELMWSKLEECPDICAELISFMESEQE